MFETVSPLEAEGLIIKDVVVLIDREQGGRQHLQEKGYNLHSVMTITELVDTLNELGKLDTNTVMKVKNFIKENQV